MQILPLNTFYALQTPCQTTPSRVVASNPSAMTAIRNAIQERLSRPFKKTRRNHFQNGMLMMHNWAAQV